MSAINQIVSRHFERATIKALAVKGITIYGLQHIGDPCNGETGYKINDNGCGRIWTHKECRQAAGRE